jgi:sugar (pentulose or hexulose) kinase
MAIAATSVGLYRDLTTAVQKTTATTQTILPDTENGPALQDEYARYIRFSDALVTAWQDAEDSEPV